MTNSKTRDLEPLPENNDKPLSQCHKIKQDNLESIYISKNKANQKKLQRTENYILVNKKNYETSYFGLIFAF